MKQIRQSVFETNSSSEHAVSVVSHYDYKAWKRGEKWARRIGKGEDEECWGNFWSRYYEWEFTSDKKYVEDYNKQAFELWRTQAIAHLNAYKEDCKDTDNRMYWNPKEYEREMKDLMTATYETRKPVDKFYGGLFLTYEEYMEALREGDCHSPFKHDVGDGMHVVFGTYFHS